MTRASAICNPSDRAAESTVDRLRRASAGLTGFIDGYELYYPHVLAEDNVAEVQSALGDADIYAVASALYLEPRFARGGLTSPDASLRSEAVETVRSGADLAGKLGAHFIIWPGVEGYDYPFQTSYRRGWSWLLDGFCAAAEVCARHGTTLLLEYKAAQPADHILLRSLGTTLYVVGKLRALGFTNVKVLIDWQHVWLAGENLAESAALAMSEGVLGHFHANASSPYGHAKRIVGASHFIEALELAVELREQEYGAHGERMGFDIAFRGEDPIAAIRSSVAHWRFMEDAAARIDQEQLASARSRRDAIAAMEAVFRALGASADSVAMDPTRTDETEPDRPRV